MISEQDCIKILNAGDVKFSAEEVRRIRDLMVDLANIEFEEFLQQKSNKNKNENSREQEPRKAA